MTGVLRISTREAISRLKNSTLSQSIPQKAHTTQVAEKMGGALTISPSHNVINFNIIAEQISQDVHDGHVLDARRLRDAIWCLWETDPALGSDHHVRDIILRDTSRSLKHKLFRNLATLYLVQFRTDRPGLQEISATLQTLANKWGAPWDKQQQDYALFDPKSGPKNIAIKAFKDKTSPTEAMTSIGLGMLNSQAGLAEEVTRNLLLQLANDNELSHQARLEKVQAYAFKEHNELLFKTLDQEIAEALIRPFFKLPPEAPVKDIFLNFLIAIFRDPRIHPARWERFPDLKALIISWLTEANLRQFLDVVSKTVTDYNDANMWKYRRAFWEAAYHKGMVKNAWVIFAEAGVAEARRSFGKNVTFSTFNSRGSRAVHNTHAVLLLQIGNGIVADWSHNGKCNIWSNAEDHDAPKLFKTPSYNSDEVRIIYGSGNLKTKDKLCWTHASPSTFSWQKVVSQRLYDMTGLRLSENDYKPRSY